MLQAVLYKLKKIVVGLSDVRLSPSNMIVEGVLLLVSADWEAVIRESAYRLNINGIWLYT